MMQNGLTSNGVVMQVQHIHANLTGASCGMQRTALADLRRDYDADYRYTGKV